MPDLAPGYARNILDEDRQGVLGRPLPRIDGPLKVTGQATYAYEYAGQGEAAYGMIVSAGVPAGRVVAIDTTEAARIPGVLLVMTHLNAPQQADYVDFPKLPSPFAFYAVARPSWRTARSAITASRWRSSWPRPSRWRATPQPGSR